MHYVADYTNFRIFPYFMIIHEIVSNWNGEKYGKKSYRSLLEINMVREIIFYLNLKCIQLL